MKLVPVFDVTMLFKSGNSFTSTYHSFNYEQSPSGSRKLTSIHVEHAPRWVMLDLHQLECFYEHNIRVMRVTDEKFRMLKLTRELTPDEVLEIDPNFDLGNHSGVTK